MIQYKNLGEQEIDRGLFQHFIRRQVVVKCLRRENNCWMLKKYRGNRGIRIRCLL